MRRLAVILTVAAGCFAVAQAGVSTDPKQAPPGMYKIEARHTQVLFAVAHLGLTDYHGRFERVSGTLTFDPVAPEKSSVSVTVDTSSANVMSTELIGEILGADVLDAGSFPTATFTSTAIERTSPTTGKMTGNLTMHGVTRPVTFDVTFNGGATSPMDTMDYMLGFHATAVIRRSDFGLTKMRWTGFVGDEITLTIEALFEQQKG